MSPVKKKSARDVKVNRWYIAMLAGAGILIMIQRAGAFIGNYSLDVALLVAPLAVLFLAVGLIIRQYLRESWSDKEEHIFWERRD